MLLRGQLGRNSMQHLPACTCLNIPHSPLCWPAWPPPACAPAPAADHFLHVINRDFMDSQDVEANIQKLVTQYKQSNSEWAGEWAELCAARSG